jgi:nitrate ABC transporter ATP-binding subunit
MSFVELDGVSKSFPAGGRTGNKSTRILDRVELKIEEGEFVSLIGHSGCGKSTVLNLTAGLVPLDEGSIRVAGTPVRGPGPDRMVAFQNHSLLPWLTIRENIALAVDAVHTRKSAAERAAIVEAHIDMVYLRPAANRLPDQVSGGMKQRCGLARAFSTRPKVLLLDEPFGALDALTRANLQDALLRLWEKDRTTVMMVTHDVDEALLLSDRIVMMSNGPGARVAEIMQVDLPRPRGRLEVLEQPTYYRQRGDLLYFLDKCKKGKSESKVKPRRPEAGEAPAPSSARAFARGLEKTELSVGFVPLLDCAPLAVAMAQGIFARNGLEVTLSREPSWKAVAEGIREGRLDAAQMVAGAPLAETLGASGRPPFAVSTAITLSRGGNAITFGNQLATAGAGDRDGLARLLSARRGRGEAPLVFGMVHPASMHNLLLRAWLASGGIDPDRDVKLTVIPPPLMVANLEQGNLAGYCVGEPWNTRAVREGLGFIAATDTHLWATHPEKVLGVSADWAARHPRTHVALVRSLLSACALCDDPDFRRTQLPALLAQPEYVGGQPEDFHPALIGPLPLGHSASEPSGDLIAFASEGGNLCRETETLWILAQLARWGLVDFPADPEVVIRRVHLETVLREAAAATGATLAPQPATTLELLGEPRFDPRAPLEYLRAVRGPRPALAGRERPEPGLHLDVRGLAPTLG